MCAKVQGLWGDGVGFISDAPMPGQDIGLEIIQHHTRVVPIGGNEKEGVVAESEQATLIGKKDDIDE